MCAPESAAPYACQSVTGTRPPPIIDDDSKTYGYALRPRLRCEKVAPIVMESLDHLVMAACGNTSECRITAGSLSVADAVAAAYYNSEFQIQINTNTSIFALASQPIIDHRSSFT